jgi:hypothetical protein
VIRADPDWKAPPGTPIITTVDDAEADTSLSFLLIERPAHNPNLALLEWRAGRRSVVRDLMGGKYGRGQADHSAPGGNTFAIRGNGGGRWYGVTAEWNRMSAGTEGPDYRHLRIVSSHEPLALYGLNVERGLSDPQAEISDSRNLSIYYLKAESLRVKGREAAVLEIKRSSNVSVLGYSGNADPRRNAVLRVVDSTDVTLANVMPVRPGKGFDTVEVTDPHGTRSVSGEYPVSLVLTTPSTIEGTRTSIAPH